MCILSINYANQYSFIISFNSAFFFYFCIIYISKLLEKYDVIVSRIALGIPMGADIDYVDALTLEMALENRKVINSN